MVELAACPITAGTRQHRRHRLCQFLLRPWRTTTTGSSKQRALFESNVDKVGDIYAKGRHRQWAKAVCELAVGGKENYFEATGDSDKLAKIVVVLKNELGSAGLDLAPFAFDDPSKEVIGKVNELLYDSLAYIVKEEHFQLRYPARVDPRPILAKEQKLVRDSRAEDWTPRRNCRQQAELRVAVGPKAVGAAYSGDESEMHRGAVLGMLTSRLEKIERAFKYQRLGGASAAPPKNRRTKGVDRYRAGAHPTPQVGFDTKDMRAPALSTKPNATY
ncbi:hypothetical protein CYMTET_44258 [Cymbomonas tetramitiformis]|uniref:Uncharacterized protein n=1 Tax=Cymbomonas tetramitiformis TaxID=36881 RepID=A0AAE0C2E0_9CHLO|nr:hypothetical protein CYMTET_44258 [Cymbomonas tetramitiformis]